MSCRLHFRGDGFGCITHKTKPCETPFDLLLFPHPLCFQQIRVVEQSHFQEIDTVRTEYLQGKGEEVLQWVLRKYELEEPIRQVDVLDGSKVADDANVLPTAATGAPGMGGVFQTEERDDGLGCKGADKVWMPPGTAGKPMMWSTPSPKIAVGGKKVESKDAWRPHGR